MDGLRFVINRLKLQVLFFCEVRFIKNESYSLEFFKFELDSLFEVEVSPRN